MSDDDITALLNRLIDGLNTQVAETRAVRVLFETFVRRILTTSANPRASFEAWRADAIAMLQDDIERALPSPNEHRAASAARFHAESLLAELAAMLPPTEDAGPRH